METWDIQGPQTSHPTGMEMDMSSSSQNSLDESYYSDTDSFSQHSNTSFQSSSSSILSQSSSTPLPPAEGTLTSAILNLLSSMVGGGSLSLPLAFHLSGNSFLSPLLLFFFGVTADFSLMCLMDSSRLEFGMGPRARRKASYEGVARAAFGERMREVSMVLVILICFMGCVAYCVLLRDLLDPIAHYWDRDRDQNHPTHKDWMMQEGSKEDNDDETTVIPMHSPTFLENTTMWIVILLITPLCTLPTLTSLQKIGALSMIAVTFVSFCVSYRSYQCQFSDIDADIRHGSWKDYIQFTPQDFDGFLTSLPLLLGCYICHFNVLTVQNEFRTPTKSKLRKTVHTTIVASTLFYFWIGWAGSMYANCTLGGTVEGNILLNFPDGDRLLFAGRMGLACTIAFAFPMMVLPARDTILRLYKDRCGRTSRMLRQGNRIGGGLNGLSPSFRNKLGRRQDRGVIVDSDYREVWANGLSALGGVSGGDFMMEGGYDPTKNSGESSTSHNDNMVNSEEKKGLLSMEMELNQPLMSQDGLAPVPTISFDINKANNSKINSPTKSPSKFTLLGKEFSFPMKTRQSSSSSESLMGLARPSPEQSQKILGIGFFWSGAFLASFVRSVDTVWGLLGSSIAIMVGFLIPFASFVKISRRRGTNTIGGGYKSYFGNGRIRAKMAKALVVFYTVLMVVCSWHACVTIL